MSHLLGLYPGDIISVETPDLLEAAVVSLNNRIDKVTGWGMGQRINAWARVGDGDHAHSLISNLLSVGDPNHESPKQTMVGGGILENLWDTHVPFQIDGNFGATAGIAEMLLQSNVGYINVLPALPSAWASGSFSGLRARGGFTVGASWSGMQASKISVESDLGGTAVVRYPGIGNGEVALKDSGGNDVAYESLTNDKISFSTVAGGKYTAVLSSVPRSEEREKINFNGNWKFLRQDAAHAQSESVNDAGWVTVGLPHDFSIPYNMETNFYVGYGWYRKTFDFDPSWAGKSVELEFEGVFQVAEVYVNGVHVGTHEGGYTGFFYDITDYLRSGSNLVAVRVNNVWQHDLAPRAGDHQFTGGIYRDVYLNVTNDVRVAWYGTFVTTPDLTQPFFQNTTNIDATQFPTEAQVQDNINNKRSNVRVQAEVANSSGAAKNVSVTHVVFDPDGSQAGEPFSSEVKKIEAGGKFTFDARSEQLQNIKLWDTSNPNIYTVITSVYADGDWVDSYESEFGFRWAAWKTDGFYLNGVKTFLDGANAHQDHGGWGNAVTDQAFSRDVSMLKEAGLNFIRGSHYPHDPSYAEACDQQGMLFWSELSFWGMGGQPGKDADPIGAGSDWLRDCYPQNPADEPNFRANLLEQLEAMIRVNRNHPSIVNWSMGNEVFFTNGFNSSITAGAQSGGTQPQARKLVSDLRDLSHLLDPTRKAGIGGAQRCGFDTLDVSDIAGYNGDGATIENLAMPNMVAEYGSHTADRPDAFQPWYDKIQTVGDKFSYTLKTGSAGIALWCAFHHGSVGGSNLARMGFVDYYRLPLNAWYWYRETKTGVPRESSISGTVSKIGLSSSSAEISNDGKHDTQIVVTLQNSSGAWVSGAKEVTLTVLSGPGVFPTGKSYTFAPNNTLRDGKGAIEFRSYYPGASVIQATSSGLPSETITVATSDAVGETGSEPSNFYDSSLWDSVLATITEPFLFGASNAAEGRPLVPSSGNSTRLNAVDGDLSTKLDSGCCGFGPIVHGRP
jgi:hypothetical protein